MYSRPQKKRSFIEENLFMIHDAFETGAHIAIVDGLDPSDRLDIPSLYLSHFGEDFD
jgi:hypothetical protein